MAATGDGALEGVPELPDEVPEDLLDGGWFEVAPDGTEDGVDDPHVGPSADGPPQLRVARGPSRDLLRRRRRARLAVFGVAALSAASMFTLVAFHVFEAQSAFSLDKLDNELSVQQRQYWMLRDQVATLSSPEAVSKAAAALGMVRPSDVTLLHAPSAARFAANAGFPTPLPTSYPSIVPRP